MISSFISYLSCYAFILVGFLLIYLVVTMFYYSRALRASRSINEKLVDSVLGSTLRSVRLFAD
jgi:hypothetical protein